MKNKFYFLFFSVFQLGTNYAQNNSYWQQQVDYFMEVSVDVESYQYVGKQKLVYTNNSSETLKKVYYHLYNNAFQPGSEMDARLHYIKDPDARMVTKSKESRIQNLKPNEIGYLKINNFKQDGLDAITKTTGTILEVILAKPIQPNSTTTFTLDFEGQIPLQIRRSGRNNSEAVALSMSQWYPKIAEFDFEGWHADPYIAREFHGVWGNFEVKITIDKEYTLGGTGYLQNPNQIGHGYQDKGINVVYPKRTKTLTWHFVAPMVHDFTWAADPNFAHDVFKGPNDVDLHFIYKNVPETVEKWKQLQPMMANVMDLYNQKIGNYPYEQYSFIQGGDGGMEYGMCTLILGNGTLEGIFGTATHELGHSWFQHVLASNEAKHPWMDEGFTTYIEDWVLNELANKKQANPFEGNYRAYYYLVNSGKEQPLTTHADRYDENRSYSIASYVKGCLFLSQLSYLIGEDNLDKTLKRFYQDFKFKHPTPNDIKRTAERVSGAELDWYLTDWTQTTNTIDYGIKEVNESIGYNGVETLINLERIGRIPMPIDIVVEYKDGSKESFYIPLRMMHFEKENPTPEIKRTVLKDWAWAESKYVFSIPKTKATIKKITIDPSGLMADVKQDNNIYKN
ncbi:M1 family metallopeptidase [Flavobacterium sp. NG2]|uniref:M1 family metallopeptidase n=1 Tax=Flavobacterium sp. NG2 TaxID=3097547 RepID=UPI002A8175AA|nr:M1 family metallopeptidase [Flavobacterium sp. NG2]WPR72193.1 M1 family metallopeptidase [Flavobacterium sp. NG2]